MVDSGRRLKKLLFIHNVLSYLEYFIDCFSHVKNAFLPKNATSKLQPLDVGMINNFKVLYRRQLLQHALARIKPVFKASYVISNGNLLRSIRWVMDVWRKVKKKNDFHFFSKCGFNEATFE